MEKLMLGFGAVIVIIVALFAINYFRKDSEGKKEAEEFLKGLEEHLYHTVLEIINSMDISAYKTFEEYEKAILEQVYDSCWKFVEKKMAEADNQNLLSVIAQKFITKENIEKLIDKIMVERDINDNMANVYGTYKIENTSEALIEEDKELQEKFSDDEEYYETFDPDKDSEVHEEPIPVERPSDEDLANLNPQKDEDSETYEDGDDSVEVVKDYILETKVKGGAIRYYLVNGETGKKKIISKTYINDNNLEIRKG